MNAKTKGLLFDRLRRRGAKIFWPLILIAFSLAVPAAGRLPPPQPAQEGAESSSPQQLAPANEAINLVQELGLTADQQTQLRALKDEHEAPIREALRRRQRAQRALNEAIYAERADEATIQVHSRELGEAQADLARLRTAVELRIRRILTPEQLQRFREIRQQQRWQRAGAIMRRNRERRLLEGRDGSPAAQKNQQLRRALRERRRQERQWRAPNRP